MTHLKKGHKLTRLGLALAYAGLLVLFACPLATSTLAWFSIGNYTRIRNIEFGFDPGTKLEAQMRTSPDEEWIDPDKDGSFRFSDEFSFAPVSNMFSGDWYSLSLDPETAFPSYMLGYGGAQNASTTRTAYATRNGQYISLEFRFTSDRDMYLFLDGKNTAVVADEEANSSLAGSDSSRLEALNRISSACRVSFLGNMGYTLYEPNKEGETYYGGRLSARPTDGYWDADEATHKEILYGEYDSEALSLLEYETVSVQEERKSPFTTMDAVSLKGNQAISNLSSLKEEGHIAKETSYTLSELGMKAKDHPLLYLPANQTRRMVVSIYLEGWDLDCDTDLQAATLAASLSFAGVYASKESGAYPYPVLGQDAKAD